MVVLMMLVWFTVVLKSRETTDHRYLPSHLFKVKLDFLRPALVSPVFGRLRRPDVSEVETVEGVLAVPLEPHDQRHRPGGAGGGVTRQGDAPADVTQDLHGT